MGERTHTPGPWRSYRDRNGRPVVKGPGTVSIADCYQPPDGDGDANARLIAAAPDMFEALIQAREWLRGWASAEPQLALIESALRKASPHV